MTPFGVYDDEMPNDPLTFDDNTLEAFLSGRTAGADQLGPLAGFAHDLRVALNGPMPAARSDLATLLTTGFSTDNGDLAATPASNVTGPASQVAGLPKWRKAKMFVTELLAGVVAKTALGVAVAAAGVVGAGAAGVLPAAAQHAVATVVSTVTPVQLPDPSSGHAKVNGGATAPGANTGGASTGLNRANQTPAAGHVPTSLPGANTGGATTGLNRANQTPAAGHVPSSLPTATAGGSGASSSGLGQANQTPAAGHTPTSVGRP